MAGRPSRIPGKELVSVSAKIDPSIAEKAKEVRNETGETLTAQIEHGLKLHIAARRRKRKTAKP